jgi:mRNA interferase RelE/StbE
VSYRVVLAPGVGRMLERVRGSTLVGLRGAILALADEPRPAGSRKLSDVDLYRVRLRIDGIPWRILYQVRDAGFVVLITRVVRRDEGTYRRL